MLTDESSHRKWWSSKCHDIFPLNSVTFPNTVFMLKKSCCITCQADEWEHPENHNFDGRISNNTKFFPS